MNSPNLLKREASRIRLAGRGTSQEAAGQLTMRCFNSSSSLLTESWGISLKAEREEFSHILVYLTNHKENKTLLKVNKKCDGYLLHIDNGQDAGKEIDTNDF